MKTLIMVCGVPGSGKTTWIKNSQKNHGGVHISRDEIRFSMVSEEEEYFSKETEVFDTFLQKIQDAIDAEEEIIYIDATHISRHSRKQVLGVLDLKDYHLVYVEFRVPYDICIKQNNKRTGRAKVPENVIRRMYWQQNWIYDKYGKYDFIVKTIAPKQKNEEVK